MPLDPAKIKARREKLGLSQTEAATRAGMQQPNWSRYESGKHTNPPLSNAEAIADALECQISKLLRK